MMRVVRGFRNMFSGKYLLSSHTLKSAVSAIAADIMRELYLGRLPFQRSMV
jgi:hypothetical protein